MPIPRGGGAKLADALVQLIRDNGGTCETGVDVERVIVRSGRAVGVRTAAGDEIGAERAVIAGVTPTQLYERLVPEGDVPAPVREGARRFRYGRSEMQIHFALSEPARWEGDERLNGTAIVHVTPGLDGVSRAVNEAERGLLPAEATVVVGQPLTMDASRAPDGEGAAVDPAAGAAVADQGRRGRRARRRGRLVERRSARAVRRPDPGAAREADPEPRVVDREARRARAARPRAGERQPAPRRPVRRSARARPELPVAAVPAQPRARDAGGAAVPHRREHVARPRPRRRLGHARRGGAAQAARLAARAGQAARSDDAGRRFDEAAEALDRDRARSAEAAEDAPAASTNE